MNALDRSSDQSATPGLRTQISRRRRESHFKISGNRVNHTRLTSHWATVTPDNERRNSTACPDLPHSGLKDFPLIPGYSRLFPAIPSYFEPPRKPEVLTAKQI